MLKIGATVVLYNPITDEINTIQSYSNLVDYVVVIDNSDEDHKSAVYTAVKKAKNVIYYSEHKNLGLCKGLNIGVEMLAGYGCEWALLLDADSKIKDGIIDVYRGVIDAYRNADVALFCPVHTFDRSQKKPYTGCKEVEWSMTSGWLVNIRTFRCQGGFFEELFVDGLDIDYCYRSRQNGHKVIECGEAIIIHHPAETKSTLGFKYGIASPYRYYMQARSLIWCWKRYKKVEMLLFYLYKWAKVVFLFPNKCEYIKNMIQGTKDGNTLLRSYRLNAE